jgi:hypothetical protein
MKKIVIVLMLMLWPALSQAALLVPKGSPVQPMPQNTAPNLNGNLNTPGNDFNNSQDQIQSQQPDENGEVPVNSPTDTGLIQNINNVQSSPTFYWVLILVCGMALVLMIIWLLWRYGRKTDPNQP